MGEIVEKTKKVNYDFVTKRIQQMRDKNQCAEIFGKTKVGKNKVIDQGYEEKDVSKLVANKLFMKT